LATFETLDQEHQEMKRRLIGYFVMCLMAYLAGCAPKEIVRAELTSVRANPEAYKDKRVILKTEIVELVNNPEPYDSEEIEVSGVVGKDSPGLDWGFYLEDESGMRLECYEREYRNSPWIVADTAVNRARASHENMTVVGFFEKGFGIELTWIEYQGQTIYTDYKPDEFVVPFQRFRPSR
jgi:hypothetical protein